MEQENDWKVSNQNKKNGKKRFLRQIIVFFISIFIIAIAVLIGLYLYNKKPAEIVENNNFNENKLEDTNTVKETIEKVSLDEEVYSIEDKDFYFDNEAEEYDGIKMYEYDNTNSEYAEIYYRLDTYLTDPSYSYIIEAKNEEGKSLLLNERLNSVSEREILGGVTSSIKIDKENVGSKIDITVKEMCEHSARSRTLERKASITLDLKKDLEKQDKIDFTNNTASYELQDIKFETYKDENVEKDSYIMITPNCRRANYSISLSTQYGNRIVSEENITFYAINNVNNLSLDEAFDIEKEILEKVGNYGLADQYTLMVSNGNSEIKNEFEITFEEMKELIAGKEINVNGKRITAKDVLGENESLKIGSNSKVTIANGIKAIKYNYKTNSDRTNYMFVLNGYIYYIEVPNAPKYKTNVDLFLNSLLQK